MKHECDNCAAMTENEPVCLCDECNSGCSCNDYERRYEDLLDKHGVMFRRVQVALKAWEAKTNVEIKQMFGNATPEELLAARDHFTQAMTELSETVK